jgi:hypothetical protein
MQSGSILTRFSQVFSPFQAILEVEFGERQDLFLSCPCLPFSDCPSLKRVLRLIQTLPKDNRVRKRNLNTLQKLKCPDAEKGLKCCDFARWVVHYLKMMYLISSRY